LYSCGAVKPNSEAHSSAAYGVIRLELKADGYDWEFVPTEEGTFGDSGSGVCH
jgi:acid phosphatase type 7